MSDSVGLILAVIVSEIIPGAIAAYAAYWAFNVRRALAGKMYRNHAMWLGIVGVVAAVEGFLTYSTNQIVYDLIAIFFSALYFFLFAFIDATIPVVRRSDPLLRPILGWEKLRIALWCVVAILAVVNYYSYSYYYTGVGSLLVNIVYLLASAIIFGISGAAILTGARRSQDQILKGSLKWLGFALVFYVLVFVVYTVESVFPSNLTQYEFFYSYYALPGGLATIAATYCLYRSARSLVPINRISLD